MPTVDAVVTRDILVEIISNGFDLGEIGDIEIETFKVGEGGFITDVGGNTPRVPDGTLSDLDIIENPDRYVVNPIPTFTKSVESVTITYDSDGYPTAEVSCLLDFVDYNDDGTGSDPQIYEIGVFTGNGLMAAYGTFDELVKNAAVQIPFTVRIVSGGG